MAHTRNITKRCMVTASMHTVQKKLLLVGGKGMLAQQVSLLASAQYDVNAVDLPEVDITDPLQVKAVFDDVAPEVVINCAAYTNVDGCETEQALAERVNGQAVGYLAEEAKRCNATLVHISTDYVFDGKKNTPYSEEDQVNPQSAYGRSKLLGEEAILASGLKKFFIVRTSWLYGLRGKNFVETIIHLASEREELGIVADQIGSPTYTADLADAIFCLLNSTAPFGVYHFSNEGQCSWYEFAKEIVGLAKESGLPVKASVIKPISSEEYPLPATWPAFSVFSKQKYCQATGCDVPLWKDSLREYFRNRNKI